jgi:hypothetical protein
MNKKQKIMRKKQREYKRKIKQETTFDLEQIRSTVHQIQHKHSATRTPEKMLDQPQMAPEESIDPQPKQHPQMEEQHLHAQPELLSHTGGETHDRERI